MALARVDFFDLRHDFRNNTMVLFLKDSDRDKFLPICIGEGEANSIELAVNQTRPLRPLTHDLFSALLERTGIQLRRVVIDRLENRTYFATLHFEHDGEPLQLDCRPSDAVAIALRENVRIYVDEELMYHIKFVELSEADELGDDEDDDEVLPREDSFQEFLRGISPHDFRDS
jgi:bifunctional DNase/RNase